MSINLTVPNTPETSELKPRITVVGVGGAGGNAVNNMIQRELGGVDFVVTNTDAQALSQSKSDHRIQLGAHLTQGLGAGAKPEIGRAAAEEAIEDVLAELKNTHMAFVAAGMGGGTGTGAAPVIARAAREAGILTVGVVTKPFQFEGSHRMTLANQGIEELEQYVDTLIIIPNQNLFRIANESTTFADAFAMADQVLYSGVRGVTDLITMPGLINLDFADIRSVMSEMGKAMMGTGEAEGERRALDAAEAAIANPLLEDTSMKGAKGVLINITGSDDITLFEVDEAASRIRSEVDDDAHIIVGSAFDPELKGVMRVSVVATGIDANAARVPQPITLNVTTETHQPAMPEAESTEEVEVLSITEELPVSMPATEEETSHDPKVALEEEVAVEAEEQPSAETAPVSALARIMETVAEVEAKKSAEPETVESSLDIEEPEAPSAESEEPISEEKPEHPAEPIMAAPAMGATDAFIPPKPASPTAPVEAAQPDPFRAADLTNGSGEQKPDVSDKAPEVRKPSLFERVTRSGRAAMGLESDTPREETRQDTPNVADFRENGAPKAEEPSATVTPSPSFSPPPARASQGQAEMTGLAPAAAIQEQEDEDIDDLDIPAFLRRQAN